MARKLNFAKSRNSSLFANVPQFKGFMKKVKEETKQIESLFQLKLRIYSLLSSFESLLSRRSLFDSNNLSPEPRSQHVLYTFIFNFSNIFNLGAYFGHFLSEQISEMDWN